MEATLQSWSGGHVLHLTDIKMETGPVAVPARGGWSQQTATQTFLAYPDLCAA